VNERFATTLLETARDGDLVWVRAAPATSSEDARRLRPSHGEGGPILTRATSSRQVHDYHLFLVPRMLRERAADLQRRADAFDEVV
jgi:hypothetical protein